MSPWSLFTHADLPPLPGQLVPPGRAPENLQNGLVRQRPDERVSDYDARRIERQAAVARAVHDAARRTNGWRRWKLEDRALLIATAGSADEVLRLIGAVEDLGVHVRRRA
jgi:hypothetical protein